MEPQSLAISDLESFNCHEVSPTSSTKVDQELEQATTVLEIHSDEKRKKRYNLLWT